MPYVTTPHNPKFSPTQQLPHHLDHKPVFAVPYQFFDGPKPAQTDMRYISVGLAQYNSDEVSIKTMRYTGRKWTRQAEELPLHRPIDMTIVVAKTLFDSQNGSVTIPAGTLTHQTSDLTVSQEQRNFGEQASFKNYIQQNEQALKDRLNACWQVLDNLKKQGKI